MTQILIKAFVSLAMAVAVFFVYPKWPLVGTIAIYGAFIMSMVVTVKNNLVSTRLIFYGTLVVLGWVFYQASGQYVFFLIPVVLGWTFAPTELTARTLGGFKATNITSILAAVIAVCLAGFIFLNYPHAMGATFPFLFMALLIGAGTIVSQNFVTSQSKPSWKVKMGEQVPDFKAFKRGGKEEFKLSDEKGRFVLVSFIRGDWCPVCQVHMQIYRKESARLKENNVKIVIVSRDAGPAAEKFAQQVGLDYDLLEDPDLKVAGLFGAIDHKTKKGGKPIALPVSFLIGPQGTLEYSSKPDDLLTFLDPNEVLEKVRATLPSEK